MTSKAASCQWPHSCLLPTVTLSCSLKLRVGRRLEVSQLLDLEVKVVDGVARAFLARPLLPEEGSSVWTYCVHADYALEPRLP